MIKVRITKARMTEVIRQYGGKSSGMMLELKNGGIDPDRPYTNNMDLATGDYIFMQEEPVVEEPEFEGTITATEVDPKAKWTENFTPPGGFIEKKPKAKPLVKRLLKPAKKAKKVKPVPMSKAGLSKKGKKAKKGKK